MKNKIIKIIKSFECDAYFGADLNSLKETEYENVATEIVKLFTLSVISDSYSIEFGKHCKAKLKIKNGEVKVEAAMNGWGDGISVSDIIIDKL